MVRKISYILFSLIMLISTVGISVSLHYCGDKLISAAINEEAKSCCEMGGCCHNETIQIGIEDNYTSPYVAGKTAISEISLLFPLTFLLPYATTLQSERTPFNMAESPPPLRESIRLAFFQSYRC